MKKLINLSLIIFITISAIYAQEQEVPPQAFNYTGFATDASGKEVRNSDISIKATILNTNDDIFYSEVHYVSTDNKGLFSIKVGQGNPMTGAFSDIPWATSTMKLLIEIDPNGGSNYVSMGDVRLMSVPYALFAGSTGDVDDADPDPGNELQELGYDPNSGELSITKGNTINIGKPDNPADEIQDLQLVGTTLRITNNPSATPINLENVVVQEGKYYFGDRDTDLYGNPFNPVWVPTGVYPPPYFVEESTDCDDNNAAINPDAEEVYDLVDNNCNGEIDENTCLDNDGDGYGVGSACLGGDCDDNDPTIFPGSTQTAECGSEIGVCQPGTRSRTCEANGQWSSWSSCQGQIGPTPEICDGLDNDCDGVVDENASCDPVNNGTSVCNGNGECIIGDCFSGYCDLNGDPSDGCEYDLDTNPDCSSYTHLGSISGDTGNGIINTQGYGEKWYRIYLSEDNSSTTPEELTATITLNSAQGTNYDLVVKCENCSSSSGGSSTGIGTDIVNIRWNEETFLGLPSGSDSGGYIYIQVKYWNADICDNYNLQISGNTSVNSPTCPDR